ncbi:hypothetical protein [Agrobacterium sp. CG674]
MGMILKAAGEGEYLTTKDLHERIPYEASYGAVRISVRFLVEQGMLQRRDAGRFTHLVPTLLAFDWYRPESS